MFLSIIVPILLWNVLSISQIFLERSLIFSLLFFPSISFHCSFKKAFLSLLAILWNSAFSWVYLSLCSLLFTFLLSSAIYKATSDNHLPSWQKKKKFFFLCCNSWGCKESDTTEWLNWTELNDPDNHDGVVTQLEPDILECEVKCALGSITLNKARGGDGNFSWIT